MSTEPRTSAGPATDWQPALVSGAVLRHDPVRGADLLVLPERVVVLQGRGGTVVGLCDGTRNMRAILEELAVRFPGAPVAEDVPAFLDGLRREGCLR